MSLNQVGGNARSRAPSPRTPPKGGAQRGEKAQNYFSASESRARRLKAKEEKEQPLHENLEIDQDMEKKHYYSLYELKRRYDKSGESRKKISEFIDKIFAIPKTLRRKLKKFSRFLNNTRKICPIIRDVKRQITKTVQKITKIKVISNFSGICSRNY